MSNNILLGILILLVLVIVGLLLFMKFRKQKEIEFNYQRRRNPFAYITYKFFSTSVLTRRYYNKIFLRYRTIYPAGDEALARRVSKVFIHALGVSALSIIFMIVMAKGNIFYITIGIWVTLVLFTYSIEVSMGRLERKLLEQLQDYIPIINHLFHDTKMLDTALYVSTEDLPPEIGLHIRTIEDMVESTDTITRVDRYVSTAPNRFLMTFAAICSSIKEFGDKLIKGQSLFIKNINYLKEEVNIEILKLQKQEFMFSGYILISLAPVFFLKPIEIWLSSNMNELKQYYGGAQGIISLVTVTIASYVCYQLICSLKNGGADENKEYPILHRLARVPFIEQFLALVENHNYSKTLRIGEQLKLTGDTIGTRAFLLKRILTAIGGFFLVIFISVLVLTNTVHNAKTNFEGAFENAIVPNESYRKSLEEFAGTYTSSYHYATAKNEEEQKQALMLQIQEETGLKKQYANEVATVVISRKQLISKQYFKAWMLLLALGGAVAGYFLPYLILKYRVSIMEMTMEDEVIQFHTLILILMYEDGVTINTVLEWMERFSKCFKDSIRKCIVNLELNQQEALKELKDSESFPPFKRFCENLMMVDNSGIEGAFQEIEAEREFYKAKRQQDNDILLEKKSSRARLIAFIPYGIFLLMQIIIPFISMALEMFKEMGSILSL